MRLENNIFGIVGTMGTGKTLLSVILSADYDRVYANFKIEGHNDFTFCKNINDIKSIEFQKDKGLLIIDESNINASSRRAMSGQNQEIVEMLVLSRKKNLDIIFIGQDLLGNDKMIRGLFDYVFMLQKKKNNVNVDIIIDVYKKATGDIKTRDRFVYIGEKNIKGGVKVMKSLGLSYNTLETSKL